MAHESNNYFKDILKTKYSIAEVIVKEIEKASDPLIKQEKNEHYYDATSNIYSQLFIEEEIETLGEKCKTRSQSDHQKAKDKAKKSSKEEVGRSQKAIKAAERRANETLKQKTDRNLREAKRIAQRRARDQIIESQHERAIRLEKIARKAAERRANESPEQKTERNMREAKRIAQKRTPKDKRDKKIT